MKKLVLLSTLIFSFGLFAQNGYNWGVSKKEGEAKFFFVQMNYNSDRFQDCRPRIQWLIKDAPDLHKDLYVMGAEVYRKAADASTDSLERIVLEDSTIYMYRQQIERFGLKAEGLNYLGKVAYKYLSQRKNQWDTLAAIYNEIVAINDSNTFVDNVYPYLITNCAMKQFGKITDQELIGKYQKAQAIVAYNQKKYKGNATMEQSLDKLSATAELVFNKYVTLNCQTINQIIDFENLTVSTANEAKKLLETKECTENYEKVLVFLQKNEPKDVHTEALADYYFANGNKPKAIDFYQDLAQNATANTIKGKAAFQMMNYYKSSNRVKTRNYARICIASDYQKVKAHEVIGQLYLESLIDCRETKDIVITRALYIAAYDEFKLAGNQAKMNEAKLQFPSTVEMFLGNYKVGQTVNTGCWINENVSLQSR